MMIHGGHKTSPQELTRILREYGQENGIPSGGDYTPLFYDDGVCMINVVELYIALLKSNEEALRDAFCAIPDEMTFLSDPARAACKEAVRRGLR